MAHATIHSPLEGVFGFFRDMHLHAGLEGSVVPVYGKIILGPVDVGTRFREVVRLLPHDLGPFIGMKATFDLDSEVYTWTEIPPPDSELWDTWKESDPVIWVRRKSPSSRWGTPAARPAATSTTSV